MHQRLIFNFIGHSFTDFKLISESFAEWEIKKNNHSVAAFITLAESHVDTIIYQYQFAVTNG